MSSCWQGKRLWRPRPKSVWQNKHNNWHSPPSPLYLSLSHIVCSVRLVGPNCCGNRVVVFHGWVPSSCCSRAYHNPYYMCVTNCIVIPFLRMHRSAGGVLVVQYFLQRLEHAVRHKPAVREMLRSAYREVLILGLIAFVVFIFELAGSEEFDSEGSGESAVSNL